MAAVGIAGCTSEPSPEPAAPVATPEPAATSDGDLDHAEYLTLLNEAMALYDDYYETRFITKSGYNVGRFWLPVESDTEGGIDMLRNQVRRYQRDNEVFATQIRDLENRIYESRKYRIYPMSSKFFLDGINEYRLAHMSVKRAYEMYLEGSGSYKAAETVFFNADNHMNDGLENFERAYSLTIEGK